MMVSVAEKVTVCRSATIWPTLIKEIRLYYKAKGIRIMVIRTDKFTTFKSRKVRDYFAKHDIERQSSTPYQHWQNSVERDIQTMIHNISAAIVNRSYSTTYIFIQNKNNK
jgi:hypothetical protein